MFALAQGEEVGTGVSLIRRSAVIKSQIPQQHTRLSKQNTFLVDEMKKSEGVVPSDRHQKLPLSSAGEESFPEGNESLQIKIMIISHCI